MKSYLRLFLTIVSFTYVLNVKAQEEVPENIAQALKAVWKVEFSNDSRTGTAFAIGKDMFVTNFHVIEAARISNNVSGRIFVRKGNKILECQVIRVDVVEDLAIFKIINGEEVTDYLKLSDQASSGNLYALGFPQGVEKILIHSKEHGIFDFGYSFSIVMDTFNLKGGSGSPVLNDQQEVVGVTMHGYQNILDVRKVDQLIKLLRGDIGLNCSKLSLSSCIQQAISILKRQNTERAKYQLGIRHYFARNQDRQAFKMFSQASKKDHPRARYMLSVLVYTIYTKTNDRKYLDEVLALLLPLAKAGYVKAQIKAVDINMKNGNTEEAVYWIRRVEQTNPFIARFLLGKIHEIGYGVEKDETKALELYQETAAKGYQPALEKLAKKYLTGDGVKQDIKKALDFLSHLSQEDIEDIFLDKHDECSKIFG